MSGSGPRPWGYWTRAKLALLELYLDRFTTASKSQEEIVYIDAFAGQLTNVDRHTQEPFLGSAETALRITDPPFSRLFFCERGKRADTLNRQLAARYPGRRFAVEKGDCNVSIPNLLTRLESVRWAPTFAFLDPDGMELRWSTVRALADHKRGLKNKVELWMLFPSTGLPRTLPLDGPPLSRHDQSRVTDVLGGEEWRPIYEARLATQIDGARARTELVNLLRWKLERELGYQQTDDFLVRNEANRPFYHMVFATDNAAGTRIMTSLYDRAESMFGDLRRQARNQRRGVLELDLGPTSAMTKTRHVHRPVHRPFGT